MAGWNFQTKNLLSSDRYSQDTVSVTSAAPYYSIPFLITHLDSVHGIFIRLTGAITGVGAVTVQLEQAMSSGSDAIWSNAGTSFNFTGTDTTQLVYPAANTTFMPNCRIKITVAAGTTVDFTRIVHTIRGLN